MTTQLLSDTAKARGADDKGIVLKTLTSYFVRHGETEWSLSRQTCAPSGYHDDCVMALALGVWGCHTFGVEPCRMMRLGEIEVGGPRSEDGGH